MSNEALCIITGITPIHIKIKETAELYKILRRNRQKNLLIDHDKLPKQWLHPAVRIISTDDTNDQTHLHGRKQVGTGCGSRHSHKTTRNPNRKTDVQNGQQVFQQPGGSIRNFQAFEYIQTTQKNEEDKAVTVHTDSMTTLNSLIITDIHTFLTEEKRHTVHELETREWKIRLRWVKYHAGTSGNELADKLAKEASGKTDLPIS